MATKKPDWKRLKAISCSKGYRFIKRGRRVMLLRKNTGTGISFECTCSGAEGGCSVVIDQDDGRKIACVNDDCTGACAWRVRIPGIPRIPPIRF